MKYVIGILIGGIVVLGAYQYVNSLDKETGNFGLAQVSVITNTSSSVGMSDTLVNTPANYQYLYASNIGAGRVSCAFTTTSTLAGVVNGTGWQFEPVILTTSTQHSKDTYDNNFLSKYMHCVADTTSTLSILKY